MKSVFYYAIPLTCIAFLSACDDGEELPFAPEPTQIVRDTGSTVSVYEYQDLTIHAYTNGPDAAGSGTYIIESASSLVLIDAQMLAPFALDYRAYADSLGNPIERVIITHEHADHWLGLGAAFNDIVGGLSRPRWRRTVYVTHCITAISLAAELHCV